MGTITVPGVGPVNQKWVYAGGALAAGIVGYSYWRRSGSSAPADVEQLPDDQAGGDVSDGFGNVPGQTGNSSGGWVPDGDHDPTTAAEWTNVAIERMTSIGYDGQAVAQAIGRWLGRQSLTVTQGDMIRTVKAIMPAVPGVNPEPPIQIGLPPTPGTGGGGTTPPAPKPPVKNPAIVTGIRVVSPGYTSLVLAWNPVDGAKSYNVFQAGRGKVGSTAIPGFTVTGLRRGAAYRFQVAAVMRSTGKQAQASNYFTGTTVK